MALSKKIRKLIHSNNSDIYCFQEIYGERVASELKRDMNLVHVLSEGIKTSNPIASSQFHNLIFSKYPVTEKGEINFENDRKDKFSGKVLCLVTSLSSVKVKIYNCYLRVNYQGMQERNTILKAVLEDALKFNGPVIICGDMNTVIPDIRHFRQIVKMWHRFPNPNPKILGDYALKNERYIFYDTATKYGFKEVADLELNTWCLPFIPIQAFNLKLDWMLYKGFSKSSYKFGPWIGDHRAIIGEFSYP